MWLDNLILFLHDIKPFVFLLRSEDDFSGQSSKRSDLDSQYPSRCEQHATGRTDAPRTCYYHVCTRRYWSGTVCHKLLMSLWRNSHKVLKTQRDRLINMLMPPYNLFLRKNLILVLHVSVWADPMKWVERLEVTWFRSSKIQRLQVGVINSFVTVTAGRVYRHLCSSNRFSLQKCFQKLLKLCACIW